MNCNPRRCFLARFAIDTMKAAPSGCCMIDHTSSHDEQAGLGVLGCGGPHRLGAHHRGGGAQLGFEQTQVEDGDEGFVAQKVVSLVGEKMSEAAGGEGPEEPREIGVSRLALLQVLVEISEAGAVAWLGVVARQGVVEGGPTLRAEALAHHHLDEASQAADALEHLLGVALVDDEGVHALAGDAGRQHTAPGCPRHVRVLALGVDDIGG